MIGRDMLKPHHSECVDVFYCSIECGFMLYSGFGLEASNAVFATLPAYSEIIFISLQSLQLAWECRYFGASLRMVIEKDCIYSNRSPRSPPRGRKRTLHFFEVSVSKLGNSWFSRKKGTWWVTIDNSRSPRLNKPQRLPRSRIRIDSE